MELPERYQLIRKVATGGMASVWCAEDQVLGRRVAVKLLSDPYATDPTSVRRFQREARVAARLSGHRHVVTIYDVGRCADGRPFIVMEYLPGGTVADALHVGEVAPEEAIRWIREAAGALDYAHGRGVIHRDIKPGNLLLDCDRVLHVADFGIARIGTDDTITRSDQVFGTAGYLSPERVVGRPATEASDRYSLAVAAFELLAGERPFTAEPFAAQARQHLEAPPPRASALNPELSRRVDAVLARGMAKAPEDRWPSACAFAEALEAAVHEPAREPRTAVLGAGAALRRPARTRGARPQVAAAAAPEPVAPQRRAPAGAVAGDPLRPSARRGPRRTRRGRGGGGGDPGHPGLIATQAPDGRPLARARRAPRSARRRGPARAGGQALRRARAAGAGHDHERHHGRRRRARTRSRPAGTR